MLRIKDFRTDLIADCLFYGGEHHYYIFDNGDNYYLVVEKMINGETKTEKYVCSGLNTAMETIELLENGGRI